MNDSHNGGQSELFQNNINPLHQKSPTSSTTSSSKSQTQLLHRLSFPRSARLFRSLSKAADSIDTNRTPHSTSDSFYSTIHQSPPMSPNSSPHPSPTSYHKHSSGLNHSRKSSNDHRRFSGTVNHYGRHSNDWLFGGFSLRDTVRDGVDRLRHGKES